MQKEPNKQGQYGYEFFKIIFDKFVIGVILTGSLAGINYYYWEKKHSSETKTKFYNSQIDDTSGLIVSLDELVSVIDATIERKKNNLEIDYEAYSTKLQSIVKNLSSLFFITEVYYGEEGAQQLDAFQEKLLPIKYYKVATENEADELYKQCGIFRDFLIQKLTKERKKVIR